jgi:hypothetical protein
MKPHRLPAHRRGAWTRRSACGCGMLALLLLAGCANGDFGRIRPALVTDGIHDWVGSAAARSAAAPVSSFRLTDQERTLRDLAYPLIEPPYDRQRWYSILGEYGVSRFFLPDWWHPDRAAYYRRLKYKYFIFERYRSEAGQYAKLIEDIRNDVTRIDPFFNVAARVADLDRKRQRSLDYISGLTPSERGNTLARIGENTLIVSWVARSLEDRAESYRYALERMVIETPSRQAVETEQALTLMQQKIARYRQPFPPPPPVTARASIKKRVSK